MKGHFACFDLTGPDCPVRILSYQLQLSSAMCKLIGSGHLLCAVIYVHVSDGLIASMQFKCAD